MNKKSTLVFFGSGPVAAKSLGLISQSFGVEAVITKPSTVKEMALACPDVPIFTASDKLELDNLVKTSSFNSDIGMLIDFGIIISQKTITSFSRGIVNSHFSLLPELRGADPISFAILEGKKETGVSLMLLVEKMDEGPVIAQKNVLLSGKETSPELTDVLVGASNQLILENLNNYISGVIKPLGQDEWQDKSGKITSYTRKLVKNDGIIDWHKSAVQIEREIRAYQGWPKSRTKLGQIDAIITKAHIMPAEHSDKKAGELLIKENTGCFAAMCGDGNYLCIERLTPAGKKEMGSQSFLAGYKDRLDAKS